jgi:hypothetical protein
MTRRDWIAAIAVGLGLMMHVGAVLAGPPVKPPPLQEFKNGRWQVQVEPKDEGLKAYWFAAGMCLGFGAGLVPIVVGRYIGRAWPAGGIGGGIGVSVGVTVLLVLGLPEGAPPVVAPAMVGIYAAVGAVAGWQGARSRAVTLADQAVSSQSEDS